MFKMIVLLKKKAGMSDSDFRDYYEGHHVALVRHCAPKMRKYVRNYVQAMENANYAADPEGHVHCVTEAWFHTRADLEQTITEILNSDKAAAIARDEERLFDRSHIRWFMAEEIESDLEQHDD